jgi:hypothetical protein
LNEECMSTADWLTIWRDRADDAMNGEPATSGFAAAINLEDETRILVYER